MSKRRVDFILFFNYATSSALFLQNQQEKKVIMTGSNAKEGICSLLLKSCGAQTQHDENH